MNQGKDNPTFVEQVGGNHYQQPIQVWDFVVANKIGFLEGNVIKYVERWERKDGLKDLVKAKSYIDKLIAVEKARQAEAEIKSEPVKDPNPNAWIEKTGGSINSKPVNLGDDEMVEVFYGGIGNFYGPVRAANVTWIHVIKWRRCN